MTKTDYHKMYYMQAVESQSVVYEPVTQEIANTAFWIIIVTSYDDELLHSDFV